MGKAERAAALTQRRQAVAVIKNIRTTRRVLASHPFNSTTFNAINGVDGGIEQMLGREILFDALTANEQLALRQEINAALAKSEDAAFETLRASLTMYFADIQKVIDRLDNVEITEKNITDLSFKEQAAVEAFKACELPEGALDYERCMSTLEHLEIIAESVDTSAPDITHELEEPEYQEEQHTHEGEPLPNPTEDPVVPQEGDPSQPVELPEVVDPPVPVEDAGEVADLTWIRGQENFFESAKLFFLKEKATVDKAGFTPEKASSVLGKYAASVEAYRTALVKVRDAIAPETCVADGLLRGSTNFFQRFDRLVCLVENLETLRDGLNKSCTSLVDASKAMLKSATKDPML